MIYRSTKIISRAKLFAAHLGSEFQNFAHKNSSRNLSYNSNSWKELKVNIRQSRIIFTTVNYYYYNKKLIYNLVFFKVDETLFLASQLMVEYKLDTLPLPGLTMKYDHQKIGTWSSVTGNLKTGAGTVVNATGIHRNGDAKISLVGDDKMVINVNIFTDPMIATFVEFDVDFCTLISISLNHFHEYTRL